MFFIRQSDFDQRVSLKAAEFCEHMMSELGAEIHDDLIQKLSLLSFHLEYLERVASDPSEVLTLLTRMRTDFETITQSVRATSRRLNPVHPHSHSFNSAIEQLCQGLQRPGFGRISISTEGEERSIPQLAFTYLYRIVQELAYNAFRHSNAWNVRVSLKWVGDSLLVEVEDDGTDHTQIDKITRALSQRRNTLAMRCRAIEASIQYSKGSDGLVAKVLYPIRPNYDKYR